MTRLPRLLITATLSVGALAAPALTADALTVGDVNRAGPPWPIAAPAAGSASVGGTYTVRSGDSLFGIAHQQGVDLGDLLAANGLTLTSVIHPGQRLVIPAAAPSPSAGRGPYTVRSGDFLFGIARRLGVSTTSLLAANGLTLTSVIHPGQRLVIPAAAPSPSAGSGLYTVRSGDSLFWIAHHQDVRLGDLLAANGLTLTSVIHPGQRLVIPAAAPPSASPGGTYTVRSGDFLFGIARRLGVSPTSLLAANGLTLTSVIHPGQQLAVPTGAEPPAGSPAPPSTPPTPPAAPRPVAGPPSTPAGAEDVERIIREVWPDPLEQTALAIARRESGYVPAAQSQCCSGLFQIYYDVHKRWLAELGIDSRADLYEPRTNAEAALALYQRAGGWGPWALPGG